MVPVIVSLQFIRTQGKDGVMKPLYIYLQKYFGKLWTAEPCCLFMDQRLTLFASGS